MLLGLGIFDEVLVNNVAHKKKNFQQISCEPLLPPQPISPTKPQFYMQLLPV
jgi:hypothetical protein